LQQTESIDASMSSFHFNIMPLVGFHLPLALDEAARSAEALSALLTNERGGADHSRTHGGWKLEG
jgi:hypothetical protein